tara:strand:+ start:7931 stop:8323 length:393 start_codon:yes stop_codon:yes gene_type:complete
MKDSPLQQWIKNFNSHQLQQIMTMYAPGAILLPTFSDEMLEGYEQIEPYFINLFDKESPECKLTEFIAQRGEGWICESGFYTFSWGPRMDREFARARFTFFSTPAPRGFVDWANPTGWQIATHHSSEEPE